MGKLNEKQINITIISCGVVVFLIFGVLCYLDYKEIDRIRQLQETEESKRTLLTNKKLQVERNKKKLFMLRANFDVLKKILPDEKQVLNFILTVDNFRKENQINAFTEISKVDSKTEDGNTLDFDGKIIEIESVVASKAKKVLEGPFTEDEYRMSFVGTYNQLGELMNRIERFDRFFSLKSFKMSALKEVGKEENTRRLSTIELSVVTFSFNGESSTLEDDELINEYLKDFKATEQVEKDVAARQAELEDSKTSFLWRVARRDPLDQLQIIQRETEGKTKEVDEPITSVEEDKPDPIEVLNEKLFKLIEDRNYLHLLYSAANYGELELSIKKSDYENRVLGIKIQYNTVNDPEGEKRKKIADMHKELLEWQTIINEKKKDGEIKQILETAERDLNQMVKSYEKGKNTSNPELFREVMAMHNRNMPVLLDYQDKDQDFPLLPQFREKMKEYYEKAETQINILTLSKKLKLEGVIFWADKPYASIAFINSKSVRKDDILELGFVVHTINRGEVILSYRGETVPIRLERKVKQKINVNKNKKKNKN